MDCQNILRNSFILEMAGLKIGVNTVSPRTCILCRKYLSDGVPDISVSISQDDIDRERITVKSPEKKEIFIETVVVYRKIVEALLEYDILLMHGAVVAIGEEAFMFSAPSGIGKTTHIKQWLSKVENSFVVNGDKPLLKISNREVIACGTPWSGNEHLNTNTMVPLKAIVLMERSEGNNIKEVSFAEAYPFLIQQIHLPSNIEKAKKTLELLLKLYGKVKVFRFSFNNFEDDCVDVAYKALLNRKL